MGDGRVVTRWRVRLPAAATCLALDAACGRIAAGCDDGVTRLLDVLDQGREIAAFATPGSMADADFGPDGASLAVLHAGTATVWDLPTTTVLHQARCSAGRLAVAGSSPGLVLPSFEGEGTARFIPLEPMRLAALARRAAGRYLTPGEWQEHVEPARTPSRPPQHHQRTVGEQHLFARPDRRTAPRSRLSGGVDHHLPHLTQRGRHEELSSTRKLIKEEVTSLPRRQNTRARPEAGRGCQSALPVKRGSGGIGVSEGRVDR
ncbi:hypothetical protein [Streptomyces sp. 900105755]